MSVYYIYVETIQIPVLHPAKPVNKHTITSCSNLYNIAALMIGIERWGILYCSMVAIKKP